MDIIMPTYYQQFRCLAAACPDSCCKEWAVQIDDEAAAYYRSLPGDLGDALRQSLQEEDGDTVLALHPDGRCPMWQDNGLCRIHAELGEAALCHTCREFPRLRHDYGSFVELGLELSCPEAARLILSDRRYETIVQTQSGGEPPEYDLGAMEVLQRSREVILAYLNRREHTVGQALAVTLLYGYAVQSELDGGDAAEFDAERLLQAASSVAGDGDADSLLEFYRGLEILTPAWKQRLSCPEGSPWSEPLRAMARYFVGRYWLQAVSDFDLVGRVKLTVASCLLVKLLGGNVLDTAQLYSKEIENDPDNVGALLDGAYTAPALTDLTLLALLAK